MFCLFVLDTVNEIRTAFLTQKANRFRMIQSIKIGNIGAIFIYKCRFTYGPLLENGSQFQPDTFHLSSFNNAKFWGTHMFLHLNDVNSIHVQRIGVYAVFKNDRSGNRKKLCHRVCHTCCVSSTRLLSQVQAIQNREPEHRDQISVVLFTFKTKDLTEFHFD